MLPNLQSYHRPNDLEEALRLIRRPGTVVLGGGTHLIPSGDPSVEAVVDLSRLGLSYVRSELEQVRVGAMTSLQQVADAPQMADLTGGLIGQVVRLVAARNLRGQATVGGMLAGGGPEHPLLVLLLALDASLTIWAPEERRVGLDAFLSYRQRLLHEGALITELTVRRAFGPTGLGFAHVGRTPRDRPIVCAAAFLMMEEGSCQEARLALGGVADRPVRASQAEHYLRGQEPTPSRIEEAAGLAAAPLQPPSDFRGSAEYRRQMAGVLARRALIQAAA